MALLHVLEVSLGSASVSKVEKNMLLPLQDMLFSCFSGLWVSVKGIPRDNHSLAQGMLLVEKPPLWCQPSLAFLLGTLHRGTSLGPRSCCLGMQEPIEQPAAW